MASQAKPDESNEPQNESHAQGGSNAGRPAPHKPKKELYPMVNWKYDLFLYVIGNLVDTFFREVVPRGSWRVPQTGPVLFVAAPHANQVSATHVMHLSVVCMAHSIC